METGKKVVGYARVSTLAQAEGLSLVAQKERIEAYAKAQGWELVSVELDAGISGKKTENRPAFQKAMGMLRNGAANALVVVRLDRLSRSLADFTRILAEAEGKWDLVSLSENFDTSTPAGRMLFHIIGSICQFEREIIAQRTKEGMAVLRQQGKLRGAVPFGYSLSEQDGKTLVPNEQMGTVRKIIALRRKKGCGFAIIASILNACQIEPGPDAKCWYPRSVYNVYHYHADHDDAA